MRKILDIAIYTFNENLKRKNFVILFIYIAVVLGSGVLFSMLSPEQEIRVILDMGTAAIEMFAFLSCAFISVRIIQQEMESKTVYLILSRPVSRASYLLGRFAGILLVMFVYILIMVAALAVMLLAKGWSWDAYFAAIALSIYLKIVIVASLSVLFSLITTSAASAFIMIFFIWTLGHFTEELKYINRLLSEQGITATFFLKIIYGALPNFSRLNYKDYFHIQQVFAAGLFWNFTYTIFYSAVIIAAAVLLFRKKEL